MKMIDDLTFVKKLGQGSFGEVYLTQKAGHTQLYATKKIPKKIADSEKVHKYFIREITILQEINHKNIMKLIEIKQTTNNYYLVCELCNGGSLSQCLDKYRKIYRKPFSEEIVQFLMRQVIDAMKYLHSCRIIHRDLKLDNILVNFENESDKTNFNMMGAQVKIIDFGFSTRLDSDKNLAFSTLGSPINMDPELLKKMNHIDNNCSGYDEKVDIWSLGTLCYEMLIGKPTFQADNMRELVQKVEVGEYEIPTSLSKEVVSFLNAMLQYDAKIRLSSEELSRHCFLTKNVKDFTRIDMHKVKNNLDGNNKMKINVKDNQSIWAIFNNEEDLDEVPGYILTENENNQFMPIPEDMSQNNISNYTNNNNYKNPNQIQNQNSNLTPNGFISTLSQKIHSYGNTNGNNNNAYNPSPYTPYGQHTNNNNANKNKSKDIFTTLQKAFDAINEEFLYNQPIVIPFIPGNDPNDKFNEEEHLY